MPVTWLRRGKPEAERASDDAKVRATVESVLKDIETRGDAAVRDLSARFDSYARPAFRLTKSEIEAAIQHVAPRDMEDIRLCMREGFVGHAEQCNIRVRRYGHRNIPYGAAVE